jgi:hypothetical protein
MSYEYGVHILYLRINRAWAVMWFDSLLSLHNSRLDAEYEMQRLTSK